MLPAPSQGTVRDDRARARRPRIALRGAIRVSNYGRVVINVRNDTLSQGHRRSQLLRGPFAC